MTNLENVDWWDSTRRSRATLLCVFFVALLCWLLFSHQKAGSGWLQVCSLEE
jgi:hypothetical protein